jgi:3-oxoadipate enol-lactonase
MAGEPGSKVEPGETAACGVSGAPGGSPGVFSRRRFLLAAATATLAGCADFRIPGQASAVKRGFAAIPGTRLYYETAGEGETVVLIHAFMLDTRTWDDQFEAYAQRYRVIRYDARGFGRSDVPRAGEPYSHADDLAALLDLLGAGGPVHVVGLSMGGRFALDFAVVHPERLRSLTVIDTVVGGWPWSRQWLVSYAPVLEASRRGDIPAAKQAWLANEIFAPLREQPAVAERMRRMVDDYSGWHLVNQDPERTPRPPTVSQLSKVAAPTLVIVGERDVSEFQTIAAHVARGVPGARRETVAGVGHLASMEAPQRVNELVLGFIAGVSG